MRGITSNFDLINMAKQYNINLDAVIYKNQLTKFDPNKNASYILDLHNESDESDGHWLALYIKGNKAIYFDSFGIEYPNIIKQFCKGKQLEYNHKQIQSMNTEWCGSYCLAFLNFMQQGYTLKQFTDLFD